MAFTSWWFKTHVNEKNIGSSSKPGEKKGSEEKKAASLGSSQPSRPHVVGAATATATKVTASSAATGKSPSMRTTETKAVKTESEKSQSSEQPVDHEKKSKGRPKEGSEPKNLPKHTSDTRSKHAHKEKALSRSKEQMVSEKSSESKKKETKSLTPALPMESPLNKPSDNSGMDAALDDLIDTLGEHEDTNKDDPPYTGPVVLDPMKSTFIEALGIKEGTIPPEYRKLLDKNEGITGPLPDSPKPLGTDHAIDALSSDFTCSSPTGKQAEKEKSTGEMFKAQSAGVTRSVLPPQEKKRKVEEGIMNDQALRLCLIHWAPGSQILRATLTKLSKSKRQKKKSRRSVVKMRTQSRLSTG